MKKKLADLCCVFAMTFVPGAVANEVEKSDSAELAQELTNPLADLLTIPVQMTYDQNYGPDDEGYKLQTNIQPVIPVELTDDLLLINRIIMPVIQQDEVIPGSGSQSGLGDTTISMFVGPKQSRIVWGVGPILYLPTASDKWLGAEKWGAGPTGVVVAMLGPWTVGGLANHVWSFAGDNDRQDISNTFLQPFAAYTWPNAWTVSLQSESTYNWKTEQWSVPLTAAVAKLVRFGKLPVSLQAGLGYWAEAPDNGPEGVRFRVQANFVLPKFY
jgi:hypothetical protein